MSRTGRSPARAACSARETRLSMALDRKSTRLNSSHSSISYAVFFFNDTAPTEIYPLPLHDALPIFVSVHVKDRKVAGESSLLGEGDTDFDGARSEEHTSELQSQFHLVCRLFF